MRGLTEKQRRALECVRLYRDQHGRPPTVRELGAALGLRSTCSVQRRLDALIRKGALARDSHRSRSLREPDGPLVRCPHCNGVLP